MSCRWSHPKRAQTWAKLWQYCQGLSALSVVCVRVSWWNLTGHVCDLHMIITSMPFRVLSMVSRWSAAFIYSIILQGFWHFVTESSYITNKTANINYMELICTPPKRYGRGLTIFLHLFVSLYYVRETSERQIALIFLRHAKHRVTSIRCASFTPLTQLINITINGIRFYHQTKVGDFLTIQFWVLRDNFTSPINFDQSPSAASVVKGVQLKSQVRGKKLLQLQQYKRIIGYKASRPISLTVSLIFTVL